VCLCEPFLRNKCESRLNVHVKVWVPQPNQLRNHWYTSILVWFVLSGSMCDCRWPIIHSFLYNCLFRVYSVKEVYMEQDRDWNAGIPFFKFTMATTTHTSHHKWSLQNKFLSTHTHSCTHKLSFTHTHGQL